jgi:hypothetical protein
MRYVGSSDVCRAEHSVLSTRYQVRGPLFSLVLLLGICFASPLLAAPPKLNSLFPPGGQRGQTLQLTAAGEFSNWPVQVWTDRPGLTTTCEPDKGKLKIEIAGDAIPGVYWLRLFDAEGASSLRPLVVGTLPEVAEAEPNDSPDKPQALDARVVVNGKLAKNGDVDGFALELSQGQTLVAAVQANAVLGSPMDSVLQVCELIPRPGTSSQAAVVEAFVAAQNHDAIGLDPQIAFTAPRSGRYLVRLFAFPSEPNSTIGFAGGDNFVYRLTLTTGGYVDHALPLALPREASRVSFAGWNVPEAAQDIPAGEEPLVWLFHPEYAGALALPRVTGASLLAAESDPPAPQELQLPATVSGRFESDGDVDEFVVRGKKDQKLRVRAEARTLGFPTDAVLVLVDESGKSLAEVDDDGRNERDPALNATLPADGAYRVQVRDLHGRGGQRLVYRLTIEEPQPDFELSLAADSLVLEAAKPLEIPLTVIGRDAFSEGVEIHVLGLPAGVTAEPLSVQAAGGSGGDSQRGGRRRRGGNQQAAAANGKIVLKADAAAAEPGGGPIRIEGRYTDEEGALIRTATFSLGLPLTDKHSAVWLTVKK